MLVVPTLLMAVTVALLLPVTGAFGEVTPMGGLALVAVAMLTFGFLNGPLDIAMFTVRQRRTDPAVLGRAFAVSMAFNFAGYPIGAALTGLLATDSLALAVTLGIVAAVAAGILAAVLIPRQDAAAERIVEAALAGGATESAERPSRASPRLRRPGSEQAEGFERLAGRLRNRGLTSTLRRIRPRRRPGR
jgi:hypothetical protein